MASVYRALVQPSSRSFLPREAVHLVMYGRCAPPCLCHLPPPTPSPSQIAPVYRPSFLPAGSRMGESALVTHDVARSSRDAAVRAASARGLLTARPLLTPTTGAIPQRTSRL